MLLWVIYITRLLNHAFGRPLTSLLEALHIHPSHPGAPIENRLTLQLIVLTIMACNFIGDGLRDAFETRLQRR